MYTKNTIYVKGMAVPDLLPPEEFFYDDSNRVSFFDLLVAQTKHLYNKTNGLINSKVVISDLANNMVRYTFNVQHGLFFVSLFAIDRPLVEKDLTNDDFDLVREEFTQCASQLRNLYYLAKADSEHNLPIARINDNV